MRVAVAPAGSALAHVPDHALGAALYEVRLTSREADILGFLAVGWTMERTADELAVPANSVRNHVTNLRAKLGASSCTEAVAVARSLGLLTE